MTAKFANWVNANWEGQSVRLIFCDRKPEFMEINGMAVGHASFEPVAEIVVTCRDFEGMRAALAQVPLCEPWPPVPVKDAEQPELRRPDELMTREQIVAWGWQNGLMRLPEGGSDAE